MLWCMVWMMWQAFFIPWVQQYSRNKHSLCIYVTTSSENFWKRFKFTPWWEYFVMQLFNCNANASFSIAKYKLKIAKTSQLKTSLKQLISNMEYSQVNSLEKKPRQQHPLATTLKIKIIADRCWIACCKFEVSLEIAGRNPEQGLK